MCSVLFTYKKIQTVAPLNSWLYSPVVNKMWHNACTHDVQTLIASVSETEVVDSIPVYILVDPGYKISEQYYPNVTPLQWLQSNKCQIVRDSPFSRKVLRNKGHSRQHKWWKYCYTNFDLKILNGYGKNDQRMLAAFFIWTSCNGTYFLNMMYRY